MLRCRGKAADRGVHQVPGKSRNFLAGFARKPLRQGGTSGNRRRTAMYFVPHLRDTIFRPADGKPQDIPARRIGYLHDRRRRRQLPDVPGILKMLDQTFGIHPVLQYNDMVQVVAAIVEREGLILIGQRTPQQSHALKWEFPGGKVEPGETPEQAVVRELEEELAIHAGELREMDRYQFAYPGKNAIELIFFRVGTYEGDLRNLIFHDLRWEPKEKLAGFDFVEGDRRFLDRLYTGTYGD